MLNPVYGLGNNDPASGFQGVATPDWNEPDRTTGDPDIQALPTALRGPMMVQSWQESEGRRNDAALLKFKQDEQIKNLERMQAAYDQINALQAPKIPQKVGRTVSLGQGIAGVIGGLTNPGGFAQSANHVANLSEMEGQRQDQIKATDYTNQANDYTQRRAAMQSELEQAKALYGENSKQVEALRKELADHDFTAYRDEAKQSYDTLSDFQKHQFSLEKAKFEKELDLAMLPALTQAKIWNTYLADRAVGIATYGEKGWEAMQEGAIRKAVADASRAESDATIKGAEAGFAGSNAQNDANKKQADAAKAQSDAAYAPYENAARLESVRLGNQGKAFDNQSDPERLQMERDRLGIAKNNDARQQYKLDNPKDPADLQKFRGVKAGAIAQSQALIQRLGQYTFTNKDDKPMVVSPALIENVRTGKVSLARLNEIIGGLAKDPNIAGDVLKTVRELLKSDNDIRVSDAKIKAFESAPTPPSKTGGEAIVQAGLPFVGHTYRWGGRDGKDGSIDCSGLVCQALKRSGHDVGDQTAASLWESGKGRRLRDGDFPQAGDIVFFQTLGAPKGMSHTGIMLDNGYLLSASSAAGKVTKSKMGSKLKSQIVGFKRFG